MRHTVGSNKQPFDESPSALPTKLFRSSSLESGILFLLLYNAVLACNTQRNCVMHALKYECMLVDVII